MVNTIAPPAVDSETGPEAGPAAPAKRLYRKPTPGGGWWVAVLLIPALLAAAAVYLGRDGLERDLATQARAALGQAGLSGTTAEFSGRIGRLDVPSNEDAAQASAVVADLPGVETVTTKLVPSNAKEAKACQNIAAKLGRLNKGQGISFAGASMTSAGSAALRSATQLLSNCRIVTIRVVGHTDGSVINGSELSLRRANIVRKALIAGGVDKERITASGFADAYPALRADSARARALNNRVTIDVQE